MSSEEALSADITMMRELLETVFWNCALIMLSAWTDSRLGSSDVSIVSELTPVAVATMGSMIAKSSIQTAIMAYLRFVIKRPSFPKELLFPWVMDKFTLIVKFMLIFVSLMKACPHFKIVPNILGCS